MKAQRTIVSLLFICLFTLWLPAQPNCYFKHYGLNDGLPQHTIMGMLQDKKGFMWFSTWDGLSKFDGYGFTNYKSEIGDLYNTRSNRMDKICEDIYGNIWILSYDNAIHRFNPHTEEFTGVQKFSAFEHSPFVGYNILPKKSGNVWALSKKTGCVCIKDSLFTGSVFNQKLGNIKGNDVYSVYEDRKGNSWILTNNGITLLTNELLPIKQPSVGELKIEKELNQPFYAALELDDEIWFGSAKGQIWRYNKQNRTIQQLQTTLSSSIIDLKYLSNEKILIVSSTDGFQLYDRINHQQTTYNQETLKGLKTNQIISTYVDKNRNVWFELNALGVAKFNPRTAQLDYFTVEIESSNEAVFPPNFLIFEDDFGRLWVQPRGGGFSLYDSTNNKLVPFYNSPSSPNRRFSNMIHNAYVDRQGNLWLSTKSHGLEKAIFTTHSFKTTPIDPTSKISLSNDVRALFEDKERQLWVATKDGNISIYNTDRQKIGHLCDNGTIGNGTTLKGITYCMQQDSQGDIWIGTKGNGVIRIKKTGKLTFNAHYYKHDPANPFSLSNDNVYTIFEDQQARLWLGTYGGGLNLFDDLSGAFIHSKNSLTGYPIEQGSQIRCINSDRNGTIYIGTTVGLITFSPQFKDPSNIHYKQYFKNIDDPKSLRANDIYSICRTKMGDTYLATFGGGVNKVIEESSTESLQFKAYTTQDGLPSDVILSIIEDNSNNLWISTEGNLSKLNLGNNTTETFSEINRLIENYNFTEGAAIKTHDGEILFPYSNGLISFYPQQITNTFAPYLAFINFKLFNKEVSVSSTNSPLNKNIDDMQKLALTHTQNFFSIEFAALDLVDPSNILYAYKLDGFDSDWVNAGKQRIANYTKLSPGKYLFRVKSTNSDGIWVKDERTLEITITPSIWQTKGAYCTYILLFFAACIIAMRLILVFYSLRTKVRLEHEETEMRTRFFIDISHEIRTPLTMIVSPVENIIEDKQTPDSIKKQLQLVLKNTSRMLRMVNQILDFRKIQKQRLRIQETEIIDFIKEITQGFNKTATTNTQAVAIISDLSIAKLWIDRDGFEKIIFNLLSNACKYSPAERPIKITISAKDKQILIRIKDEGDGMSKEIQNKLFIRFASFNKDKSKPSTGIGLSIVKELIDRHHAQISVESEIGKGSCFILAFQTGFEHYQEDDEILYLENTNPESEQEQLIGKNHDQESLKATILVVEDDVELCGFISLLLKPLYTVYQASNGKEALQIALEIIPDFIVSDIMMPVMDGVELLQNIRKQSRTSHIPFILLTAKTNMESKIESLHYGADDYITKPFSVVYFKARIENIIKQRTHLQQLYQHGIRPSEQESSLEKITKQDKEFMQKVVDQIDKNMDNSELSIDDLARSLSIGRTVFFKKMKSLTGLPPVEFVRDYKIKYAAQLLLKENYSIKEISYMVGMSDTRYFSKCFKAKYGVIPSEFKISRQ